MNLTTSLSSHLELSGEDRLSIIRAACFALAEKGTPVVLIMDSVSTLVNAATRPGPEGLAMAGFIRTLFDMNEVLVCVPVASSATTVITLQQSKRI